MKSILLNLILIIGILCPCNINASCDDTVMFPVTLEPCDDSPDDLPDRGLRSSPIPVVCVIDFSRSSVIVGQSDEIIAYEIWSADQAACLFVSDDEAFFVETLSGFKGEYCIRLLSESHCYKGLINL